MLYAVDFCGNKSGKEIDKFSECKFHKFKGDLTGIPLIHECPINMECSVENIIPLGSHDLFISKVLRKYVDENFIIDDNSPITLDVITYVKPNYYQINNEVLGKYGYTNKK
jgi:flavin reductase (DIM6/NTAB) family NADH-FMN oxidoreductase RutF